MCTLIIKPPINKSCNSSNSFRHFFIVLLLIIISYMFIVISSQLLSSRSAHHYKKLELKNLQALPEVKVKDKVLPKQRNRLCTYWDCFNLYNCGNTGHDRITVYVYPPKKYVDENHQSEIISREFYQILKAIIESKYYTANPNEACIYIPSIDTLNQERFDLNFTGRILQELPFWRNGENHLFFSMIAGIAPDFTSVFGLNIGNAMIAGADFDTYSYRVGFDIAIPLFSPMLDSLEVKFRSKTRKWFLTSSQINIDSLYLQGLEELQAKYLDILVLDACFDHNYTKRCEVTSQVVYSYPKILQESTFCAIFRGERMGQFVLLEAMASSCIPVVIVDSPVMPFSNVIDWKRAAIFIMEDHMDTTMEVLKKISPSRINDMQKQVQFLYNKYFKSLNSIVETSLDIIQDRVFPQWARIYDDWNIRPDEGLTNPLFLPITAPKVQGFTAVILTYDRIDSLFDLIQKISKVPSLIKILVVWNNQRKAPPSLSRFPQISTPINVIRTKANKLSNRFFPFEEIETEAILSIDDDIVMLTSDELEFGYEVWREFPDRIVGFPSRTHIWDNLTTSWRYESEWTNEISMVLTGAAFYHKYWNYLYTTAMPNEVKDWVDTHMNCEDIAMNFLVSNITNKPPIKVAPRKKFKCPKCTSNEMLSADLSHMVERSRCVDIFAKAFGRMPLQTVEFRADPVLFKDPFPEKLKRFNNIGSL